MKYYVNKEGNDIVPYGFGYLKNINGYDVYQSPHALDLCYGYDNYITESEFEKLDTAERNEILTQAAVVDEELSLIAGKQWLKKQIEVPYSVSHGKDIEVTDSMIKVTGDDAYIILDAKCEEPGEYYVLVDGLYSNQLVAYIRMRYRDIERYFIFKGNDNQHYTDRHEYLVDLGYLEGLDGTVMLDFTDGGTYDYRNIRIICQPLEGQIEELKKLSDIGIKDLVAQGDVVSADVDVKESKFLCFSVPYSKGWKAYVDGREVKLHRCNIQYMGLELEKGSHHVELRYHTPLMRPGLAISIVGLVTFVSLLIMRRRQVG